MRQGWVICLPNPSELLKKLLRIICFGANYHDNRYIWEATTRQAQKVWFVSHFDFWSDFQFHRLVCTFQLSYFIHQEPVCDLSVPLIFEQHILRDFKIKISLFKPVPSTTHLIALVFITEFYTTKLIIGLVVFLQPWFCIQAYNRDLWHTSFLRACQKQTGTSVANLCILWVW